MPEPVSHDTPDPIEQAGSDRHQLTDIEWGEMSAGQAQEVVGPADPGMETTMLGIRIGSTTMALEEVSQLGPDQLIPMDQLAGDPVTLLLDGNFLAEGILVTLNGQFSVRITRLDDPAPQPS